ncbi:methylthioribulose 1-phosphate dehydratase [Larsenimonas rhizosphaerae]|uniref:methylthioribulose 1-phosphate dehydratase n=1 Tax=Larsenimonas rhizosphaerae TaxID=2944682 RepID=UPI002033774F|nr:methylthioribulose 1-phosphate dehydratase [Larsenimonas rhizosphaerae]MCM2130122.1 methylthioribulose 1-phosphate dehydratase [Larsenimonas rhizosphaerae]
MIDLPTLATAQQALVKAGRTLHQAQQVPASGGNFSVRLDRSHMAVTVSGRHKGHLSVGDIMVTDLEATPVGSDLKPSDEALLHGQIYRLREGAGAVLHTHCRAATALSMLESGDNIILSGYELLKVFDGVSTHLTQFHVPVVDNSQDIPALAAEVEQAVSDGACHAYLIRGHGLYTWAGDLQACLNQVEALSVLFDCELTLRQCR